MHFSLQASALSVKPGDLDREMRQNHYHISVLTYNLFTYTFENLFICSDFQSTLQYPG